jgi:hypothetical protein
MRCVRQHTVLCNHFFEVNLFGGDWFPYVRAKSNMYFASGTGPKPKQHKQDSISNFGTFFRVVRHVVSSTCLKTHTCKLFFLFRHMFSTTKNAQTVALKPLVLHSFPSGNCMCLYLSSQNKTQKQHFFFINRKNVLILQV